jgi:hypothetical protein
MLFLGNVGVIPLRNVWDYWPLLLIVPGLAKLMNDTYPMGRLFGGFLIAFGAVFLLSNLGVIHVQTHDRSWPLSILLIAFGLVLLKKVVDPGSSRRRIGFPPQAFLHLGNRLKDAAIAGSIRRKVDSANFQGGQVLSVLGSADIDLRKAQIPSLQRSATLELTAVFGAIKIRVPESWRISIQGTGILGQYEDKTIPPRMDVTAPLLIITGAAVFGSVEIED